MDTNELKIYYTLISEMWKTLKTDLQHESLNFSDADWNEMINGYTSISDKYRGTPAQYFGVIMANACLEELDRIYRRETWNG